MPSLAEISRQLPHYRPEAKQIREPYRFALYLVHLALIASVFLHPAVAEATGVSFAMVVRIAGAHACVMVLRILLDFEGYAPTLFGPLFWIGVAFAEPAAATVAWFLYVLEASQDGLLVRPSTWHAALLLLLPVLAWATAGRLGFAHTATADPLIAGSVSAFGYAWISGAIFSYAGRLEASKRVEAARIRNEVRERIAADLHDGLGATFTGMALRCRAAAVAPPAEARAKVEEVLGMSHAVLRKMRLLAKSFGPEKVSRDEFEGMLRELLAETAPGMATFYVQGDPPAAIDQEFVYHLLHLVAEATANAVRHGRAAHIAVGLTWQGHAWRLEIDDDGAGMPSEAARRLERASALASRAGRMGALLRVEACAPQGVRLAFTSGAAEPA